MFTWFQIEKSYIVSELCENRFVEDSDCGGHCVLAKKIDDVQPQKGIVIELKLLSFILESHPVSFNQQIISTAICDRDYSFYTSPDLSGLLKPPIS